MLRSFIFNLIYSHSFINIQVFQEVEKLCASIALKQKFEKIVQRLKTHLDEIEQNRQDVVSQKQVEKVDLEERIQEIKECSNQVGASLNKLMSPKYHFLT